MFALALAFLVAAVPARAVRDGAPAGSARLFAYDHAVPFAVQLASQFKQGDVLVREFSFAVDRNTRLTAYLVTPPRQQGKVAGVLFAPGRQGTRDYFLSEAVAVARRGAVAISVDDLPSAYPTFTAADLEIITVRVIALRRAIDLLVAQPGVDRRRLGYVGHSDGAELGGILAGVDRRIAAYVLMSGGGLWDRPGDAAYDRLIGPADPDNYIVRAAPAALFYQSGLSDEVVAHADGLRYQELGSKPKVIRWYAADHRLNAQALLDRQAWLGRRLRLFGG